MADRAAVFSPKNIRNIGPNFAKEVMKFSNYTNKRIKSTLNGKQPQQRAKNFNFSLLHYSAWDRTPAKLYNAIGFTKQDYISKHSRLSNRGPDSSSFYSVDLADGGKIKFCGYVLHLRGKDLVRQPAVQSNGDVLLWNAEVFGGVQVDAGECDTQVILDILANCTDDDGVLSELGKIQGPWSFLYWQQSSESLWFGRDVFGRRSLLWHLPDSATDVLSLSSVQILPWDLQEVPSLGIYRLKQNTKSQGYNLTLFPWQRAVWPGTLDPVTKDNLNRLYTDRASHNLNIELIEDKAVFSQMPPLNKTIPHGDVRLPPVTDSTHLQYLQDLLKKNDYLRNLSDQLIGVLQLAVKTRVENQRKIHATDQCALPREQTSDPILGDSSSSQAGASQSHDHLLSYDCDMVSTARVAILFSGGIDSAVLATLADRVVPADEPVDLINVAFEQKPKTVTHGKKASQTDILDHDKWAVPDRQTGCTALEELNPKRHWNFIEVNVTAAELQEARAHHIQHLVYPLKTVLDDSIGCAVWFAARGCGVLGNGPDRGKSVVSTSRVILCGMGADEQLIGYSRHRGRFQEEGWEGLLNEIELEITRISARNLGRDDRIITDHGKESRFPFLDERVVQFLSGLPIHQKADLNLPRGLGEKLLLRLAAVQLGLHQTAVQPKRAIQFGSRIAKMENSKEKASDTCSRLNSAVKDKCLDT